MKIEKLQYDLKSQVKSNPAFCIMPFTHTYVTTTGASNLCCIANWGTPVVENVQGTDLQDIWTSDDMQKIRQDMLDGKFEKRCSTCYKQDKTGGGSDRQSQNYHFTKWYGDIELDVITGNDTGYPLWADIRPGRMCNFGCRMCFGAVSSKIADEQLLFPETQAIMGEEWLDVDEWIDDPVCFKSIQKQIPHMRILKLAGGEPLFMPGVIKLLNWCVESNNTHLRLDITTNGSRTKGKVTSLLPKFKAVDIQFSMCGIGYTNDYIRYGANWEQLNTAYANYIQMPNVRVHLLATAQLYNAWDLPKLVDYWVANGSNGHFIFNIVDHPKDMQLDLLPLQDRLQIALELEDRLSVFNEEQCNISRIHHIINRLKQPEDKSLAGIAKQTDLIRALVNRTVTYDRIRKQDVTKIHPKLSEVFKKWKTL
jgi:MoaA/NifB/PqqE/SkfB family radical SAM enzyme|tara:strand:- start:1124 stop:2392 length:1269 start_codon:yes stop_codon:yes gene_type:complete